MYMHIIYRWLGGNNWQCYYLGYDVNYANDLARDMSLAGGILYVTRLDNDSINFRHM